MATVLYPGSFDPIHLGHLDIIEQASRLFGKVVVAILHNPEKHGGVFSVDERIALIQIAFESAKITTVEIHAFPGLAVDAARVVQADFMVKGLRNSGDFEIEQQMAHTNFAVAGIPTVYLPCSSMPSWKSSPGSPSFFTPMLPVATPLTRPCSS